MGGLFGAVDAMEQCAHGLLDAVHGGICVGVAGRKLRRELPAANQTVWKLLFEKGLEEGEFKRRMWGGGGQVVLIIEHYLILL